MELNQIFTQHKGDHNVTFEVMELRKLSEWWKKTSCHDSD